jgi:hypothetical protein
MCRKAFYAVDGKINSAHQSKIWGLVLSCQVEILSVKYIKVML